MNSHVAQVAQAWRVEFGCVDVVFCELWRSEKFYPGRVDGRQNGCPAGPSAGHDDA